MQEQTRILIADDHPIVRQGLRTAVERERSLVVIAEAGDGRAAWDAIVLHQPAVAIVDISMPELDGLQLAEEAQRRELGVKLIILTIHRDPEIFERATSLGVMGYVLKDSALVEIVSCIRAVLAGRCYASPAMAGQMMERKRKLRDLRFTTPGLQDLTHTEKQVLLLLADYRTSTEIAEVLHISSRTVDTHRSNICSKLELHGKHALMKFAVTHRTDLS